MDHLFERVESFKRQKKTGLNKKIKQMGKLSMTIKQFKMVIIKVEKTS